MKLASHNNSLHTNADSETQNFGIGDASVVIDILRNRLYENKIRTLVQEYICNARDAMREVNKNNSFEVNAPTALSPVFKVRDFGPGISPDRMANVFVLYGASTKRKSNNQTGGFGIGAKSAWSYTDSFTIVSFVDGVKRSYVAHTGVNNNGRLDLVSETPTSEPNGTEISIAVKDSSQDIAEFRNAILRAVYFWDDKPILKGGLEPATLVRGVVVNENIEVLPSDLLPEYVEARNSNIICVIDGVIYSVQSSLAHKIKGFPTINKITKNQVILRFGNGIVEVSASRESIADSAHTVSALDRIAKQTLEAIQTFLKDKFAAVKTPEEHFEVYYSLYKDFNVDDFATFDGYKILYELVSHSDMNSVRIENQTIKSYGRGAGGLQKQSDSNSIRIKDIPHIFYQAGTNDSLVVQSRRAKEYLKGVRGARMVILYPKPTQIQGKDAAGLVTYTPGLPDMAAFNKLCKDFSARDFNTLPYTPPTRVVKTKAARADEAIVIHRWNSGNRHHDLIPSKNTQKWLYFVLGECPVKDDELFDLSNYVYEYQFGICGVAKANLKNIRSDANFTLLLDWLKNWKPTSKDISNAKAPLRSHVNELETLKKMKTWKDPVLKAAIFGYEKIAKTYSGEIPDRLLNVVKELPEYQKFAALEAELKDRIEKHYKIINRFNHWEDLTELEFYINAKYELIKE